MNFDICIWKESLIPVCLIIILMLVWKLSNNMDIQPVFNEYKTMTYMCQYLSKTEDRCLQERKALRKSSQGRLWEQHASSWHHENNC